MKKLCLAPLLLALTASCVPEVDTDLTRLTEPRLLAVASTPAEAQAGKQVTLQALIAVPEGADAPRLDWTMCQARKPLTELGPVSPACLDPNADGTDAIALGSGDTVTATLDKDVCKLFGPLRPVGKDGKSAGRPVDPDITGGFYQPFIARLGGAPSLGAVRIDCDLVNVDRDDVREYRNRYRVNENPRISQVTVGETELAEDAEPLRVRAGEQLTVRVSWDECSTKSKCGDGLCTAQEDASSCAEDCGAEPRGCTGAEPYVWFNRENGRVESRREGITVAWYTSRGRFRDEQTGLAEEQAGAASHSDNVLVLGSEPGPATVWMVIRDSRGGQSWAIRRFEVEP